MKKEEPMMKTGSIDAVVADAPKGQGIIGKYANKIGRFGAIATAAVCLGYAEIVKGAPLDWSVQSSPGLFDSDEDGLDDALGIIYTVYNLSEIGDANNMISFTVSAGSNQGVYNASAPVGWLVAISGNETTFTGQGNYIASPYGQGSFSLYSTQLSTQNGTANAMSAANGGFNSQVVITPVPEPLGMQLLLMGLAALGLKRDYKKK